MKKENICEEGVLELVTVAVCCKDDIGIKIEKEPQRGIFFLQFKDLVKVNSVMT